jgi:Lrp/AsnC family transcriptional regulator, leucine-responsive regulatory protein
MSIDKLDRQILAIYQHDTRLAAEEIGAQVGLSAAAVQRRLKRLREESVIVAETASLDLRRLGLGLVAIVGVDLVDESARAAKAFLDKITARGDVQQCYTVTGPVDYVLIVIVADLAAYQAFCDACLLHDPNVRSYTTQIVLESPKRTVPVDLPG